MGNRKIKNTIKGRERGETGQKTEREQNGNEIGFGKENGKKWNQNQNWNENPFWDSDLYE